MQLLQSVLAQAYYFLKYIIPVFVFKYTKMYFFKRYHNG